MPDLPVVRRRQIEALLQTRNDWIRVPGARPLGGDGELLQVVNGSESEQQRQERKAMERRYRERLLAEADGEAEGQLTRNEAAYRAHMASGSYVELDQALLVLRRRQTYSYWILDTLYVQGIPMLVQDYRLDAALRALSDLLPAELHVPVLQLVAPDEATAAGRAERDRQIVAHAAAGKSTRWIAKQYRLTQPRVVQILGRERRKTLPDTLAA